MSFRAPYRSLAQGVFMRKTAFVLALLASGCSASSHAQDEETALGADSSATCAARSGVYKVTFEYESGTCGQVAPGVVSLDKDSIAKASALCSGGSTESSNGCQVTLDTTCPTEDPHMTLEEQGGVKWSVDGAYGRGLVDLILRNQGATSCIGQYTIIYMRQ